MTEYIGKTCPYCKTAFKEGDDIVLCSVCEMPHHKDCWIENQGCTTFGCMGTIKTADGAATAVTTGQMTYEDTPAPAPVNQNFVFCTKCGTRNNSTGSFCTNCGNRLTTAAPQAAPAAPAAPTFTPANPANTNPYAYTQQAPAPQPQPVYQQQTTYQQNTYQQNTYQQTYNAQPIDPDMQRLIGVKTEYYMPKFQELNAMNKQTSWNWGAFLFTPLWLIYRKMYAYGAAALGAAFILSLFNSTFVTLLTWVGYVAFGIFGNFIYMKHLETKLQQAKAMAEPYRTDFITKNGGVNSTATILTVVGFSLLILILTL